MIVTVTPNPLLDYVLHSENLPNPGGRRVDAIPYTVGGKGINVARMLKTLGRPALALSFAGGENGRKIRETLKQQGISAELFNTSEETRMGINFVVENPLYHTWWIENGSELSGAEVDQIIDRIKELQSQTSFIALSGTIPGRKNDDFYLKILEACSGFKGEIYLDARGIPLQLACKCGGFFLKHNREEAIETFSLDPFNVKDQKEFFANLARHRVWGAMITNGKSDVLLWEGDRLMVFAPAPAREVSAVGCGDATLAGLIYGRSQGLSFVESACWGLAAGAADSEMPGPCEADYKAVEARLSKVRLVSDISTTGF